MTETVPAKANRRRLERAAELYLHFCFANRTPVRMSEFAAQIGVNMSYLSRIVPQVLGESLHSYLQRRQLQRASELLRATPVSLSMIADESGFGTISTFYRAFVAHFGQTPASFRRTNATIRRGSVLVLRTRPTPIEPLLAFDADLFSGR